MEGVASAGIGQRFTNITRRELKVGGGGFLLPADEERFRRMLGRHNKIVERMVILTVPHVTWNLKLILVPRAHILRLMELLKEKVEMGILEPSNA